MNTYTWMPSARPRSFTVSVLPVPAGPAGAPPSTSLCACVRVMTHLSVSGVMTRHPGEPMYSYMYGISASHTLIWSFPVFSLVP